MKKILARLALALALFLPVSAAAHVTPASAAWLYNCSQHYYVWEATVSCSGIDFTIPGRGQVLEGAECYNGYDGHAWVSGQWVGRGYTSYAVCPSGFYVIQQYYQLR